MQIGVLTPSSLQQRIILNALAETGFPGAQPFTVEDRLLEQVDDGNIHMVISGKVLPNMTGFDLARAIREEEESRYTPIIMLGEQFTRDEVVGAMNAGINRLLITPVHPEDLAEKVSIARTLHRGG